MLLDPFFVIVIVAILGSLADREAKGRAKKGV